MNWRDVVGYEGKYEVSSCGLVRKASGHVLAQSINSDGYALVRLSGPRKLVRVHRIVAMAFVENHFHHPVVNHIDCIRANNSAENLEWCTQWGNLYHSQKLGRMQRDYWVGKRSPSAKLSNEEVANIRNEYAVGDVSFETLAKKFATNKRTVGRIIAGDSYV